MKFEIDLNSVSVEVLEKIVELKRLGALKEINNNKPTAEPKAVVKEKTIVVAPKNKSYKKRTDWSKMVHDARRVIKKSSEPMTIDAILHKIKPERDTFGGGEHKILKELLLQNTFGIRVLKRGKTMVHFASVHYKKASNVKVNVEHRDYMSNRGKYVIGMAKRIRSEHPDWEWSRCMSEGQMQFNRKFKGFEKGQGKLQEKTSQDATGEIKEVFPLFNSVKNSDILISLIKNLIGSKSKLRYEDASYPLEITKLSTWSDFCTEIIAKSSDICKFFKADNRFRIYSDGKSMEIRYAN